MSDMSLPFSVRLLSFAGCLQCHRPPQQVIDHRLGLRLKLGESFVHVAALVMRPKGRHGNVDGRANRGDLNLYHGFPELLDTTRAHGAAIAYEGSRLAVPLRITRPRTPTINAATPQSAPLTEYPTIASTDSEPG